MAPRTWGRRSERMQSSSHRRRHVHPSAPVRSMNPTTRSNISLHSVWIMSLRVRGGGKIQCQLQAHVARAGTHDALHGTLRGRRWAGRLRDWLPRWSLRPLGTCHCVFASVGRRASECLMAE